MEKEGEVANLGRLLSDTQKELLDCREKLAATSNELERGNAHIERLEGGWVGGQDDGRKEG